MQQDLFTIACHGPSPSSMSFLGQKDHSIVEIYIALKELSQKNGLRREAFS